MTRDHEERGDKLLSTSLAGAWGERLFSVGSEIPSPLSS